MTTNMDWQGDVGRVWAEMYRQTDRSFAGLTQQLLDRITAIPGEAVLDIGCGAGELALAIARVRPRARVIGIDVSPALVEVATSRAAHHPNAGFAVADASRWRDPAFAPDLIVSRHGVMFFADPVAAFAHLREQAAPGARLVFSCFRSPRDNRWVPDMRMLFPDDPPAPPPQPGAPGPFAFADPDRVAPILQEAGWHDLGFEAVDFAYVAGTGTDPVADALAYFSRIGPAATAIRAHPEAERARALARLRAWIEENVSASLVAFPAAAWIVSATA
jgi:SAM-dependent methyltransferase